MDDSSFRCAACGGQSGVEVLRVAAYPAYLVPLPEEIARDVAIAPLRLSACADCGHLQLSAVDQEVQRLIYEVYYSHYVVDSSEALVPHYREPFRTFVAELARDGVLRRGSLLEIGCSSGESVPFFEQFCGQYTGVDPSEKIETARRNHPRHTFHRGYFPDALPPGNFDAVVTQFNLEHMPRPDELLLAVRARATPDTVLILQVPDVDFFQRTAQPNFLAHEHLHYFRRGPLVRMLRRAGFEAVAFAPDGPSLICAARPAANAAAAEPPAAEPPLAWAERQARIFAARPALPGESVLFYGVGPLLYWLLQGAEAGREFFVVDDNPKYAGQALPGYGTRIERPGLDLLRRAACVVLSLNVIYHPKVLDKLRAFGVPLVVHAIENGAWRTVTLSQ